MKTLSLTIIFSILTTTTLFGLTLTPNTQNNSLIVYNSNIGLVHEVRKLNLKTDDKKIIYEGVASTINTDSVNVDLPNGITLFSQQYRFDKLTQKKLLDAHIGKKVSVRVEDNAKSFKTIQATLLSNDGANAIVKTDDKIIITVESKNIIFTSIPSELITKPSLVWNVSTSTDIESKMSIDYLINRIGWKSNYILNLKKDKANLTGWITIDNRSGKAFKDTNLHVLAGEINRAREPRVEYKMAKSRVMNSEAVVNHQAHEGYHFYTIPFKVTLANNEKTQIKFIKENNLDVKRKYSATMQNPNYLRGEINHDVTQHITLKGFKYPLPKGIVRSYSKLKNTNILLGESLLKHTPKDTPISLKIGKNFDVKVKETLQKRDDGRWNLDIDLRYTVKNSSDEAKIIEILVPFNKNDRSEVSSDEKYTYTKGNLVTFNISVKPQSTKEFKVHFKTKK